jgi:hypothetical protein
MVGVVTTVLGILALLAVWLDSRRWLPFWVACILAWLVLLASGEVITFTYFSGHEWLLDEPDSVWLGLWEAVLFYSLLGILCLLLPLVPVLIARLATTPVEPELSKGPLAFWGLGNVPDGPLPAIRWVLLVIWLGLGLGSGSVLGGWVGASTGRLSRIYEGLSTTIALPVVHRPFALQWLVVCCVAGLVIGGWVAWGPRLRWRIAHLPASDLGKLGVWLLVFGGMIVGISFWFVP